MSTFVRMGDGIGFHVEGVSYRQFQRTWEWALIGGRWHGFWFRFHLRIGVEIRRRIRFVPLMRLDGGRVYLNPGQITYICDSGPLPVKGWEGRLRR